ncbi:hypothetical protein LAC03_22230 [Levilactobacillus acidifarinae]|nr:hypothetical protein LAC03_22230 [Levilactobacillus acidifarinae]
MTAAEPITWLDFDEFPRLPKRVPTGQPAPLNPVREKIQTQDFIYLALAASKRVPTGQLVPLNPVGEKSKFGIFSPTTLMLAS